MSYCSVNTDLPPPPFPLYGPHTSDKSVRSTSLCGVLLSFVESICVCGGGGGGWDLNAEETAINKLF